LNGQREAKSCPICRKALPIRPKNYKFLDSLQIGLERKTLFVFLPPPLLAAGTEQFTV